MVLPLILASEMQAGDRGTLSYKLGGLEQPFVDKLTLDFGLCLPWHSSLAPWLPSSLALSLTPHLAELTFPS